MVAFVPDEEQAISGNLSKQSLKVWRRESFVHDYDGQELQATRYESSYAIFEPRPPKFLRVKGFGWTNAEMLHYFCPLLSQYLIGDGYN
jgi:hypothetical protein